jgi:two-component system sensor histidine kinase UhpB
MKRLLACVVLLLLFLSGNAQSTRLDSLKKILASHPNDTTGVRALLLMGDESSNDDIKAARRYFRQALRLSEKLSATSLVAESYLELGQLYHADGDSDSALIFHRRVIAISPEKSAYAVEAYQEIATNLLWLSKYDSARLSLDKALAIAVELNDADLQAGIHNDLGNLALQISDRHEALKQYLRSAKLQDSLLHDPIGLARAMLNIGTIQFQLNNDDKAIQYTTEALAIAEKNNFTKGVAYAHQSMGRILRRQKKLDEALAELKKAVEIYKRMGEKRSAAETELSIGNIYFDKSDFKQAEVHYFSALKEVKSISNQTLTSCVHAALGYNFQAQKLYDKAAKHADTSRVVAKSTNDQYVVLDAYNLLMAIHQEQNHYKEALEYSLLYGSLNDSLQKAENKAAVAELEIKYQDEKKAAEIELLKADKNRQQTIQIATIIILFLVIVVALVLVNRYRIVHRTKRMLEIERVRNTIARDLHDDIGSTLSSINILSKVALVEKNGNAENYLQRIGDQSSRMMEDISDIVWSINPHNDSMSQAVTRMREFSAEVLESKNISLNFSEKLNDDIKLDADKRKNLFLIFKESVNNAAKYSKASRVDISLEKVDHTLVMKVKDDGQGFDETTIKAGNGLRNLRERAREIEGTIKLTSQAGKGTEIELRLPLA